MRERKIKFIPLTPFRKYLSYINIKDSKMQTAIINTYKNGLKDGNAISYMRSALEGLGFDAECTYQNISNYIIYPEFRKHANDIMQKLEEKQWKKEKNY